MINQELFTRKWATEVAMQEYGHYYVSTFLLEC